MYAIQTQPFIQTQVLEKERHVNVQKQVSE